MKTRNNSPLRKVVKETYHGAQQVEILECGHRIARKLDIYGYTNAYRRRCYKCRDGKHPDMIQNEHGFWIANRLWEPPQEPPTGSQGSEKGTF